MQHQKPNKYVISFFLPLLGKSSILCFITFFFQLVQSTSKLFSSPKSKMGRPIHLKEKQPGLPWWLSGKETACQCRRQRSGPWSRKIPHPMEQQSLCSRAQELQLLNSMCTQANALQ